MNILRSPELATDELGPPSLDSKPFLALGDGWALAADSNQWTLCRRRLRQGVVTWQPVSFVGSSKRMLSVIMIRRGIKVDQPSNPSVHAFLAAPPVRFLEWAEQVRSGSV